MSSPPDSSPHATSQHTPTTPNAAARPALTDGFQVASRQLLDEEGSYIIAAGELYAITFGEWQVCDERVALRGLPEGEVSLEVRATDKAGNVG